MNNYNKIVIPFLLLSMLLVGFGTHLQAKSPNLEPYLQYQMDIARANNPGKDMAPGLGVGLAMAIAWPFTVLMQGFLIILFAASASTVYTIAKRSEKRIMIRVTFPVFVIFWGWVIYVLLRSAVDNARWDFTLLVVAEGVTSIGLILGCIGLFKGLTKVRLKRDI
jgi:hypothetical protein